jgi:hypothetical protein
MGAAKSNILAVTAKGAGRFDLAYQAEVEADIGLHHAVAFERVTGWPVHGTYVGSEPIRFHNEDGWMRIFDVRGIMSVAQHSQLVTDPILSEGNWARAAANREGNLEIGCTCLGEDGIVAAGVALRDDKLASCEASSAPTRPI